MKCELTLTVTFDGNLWHLFPLGQYKVINHYHMITRCTRMETTDELVVIFVKSLIKSLIRKLTINALMCL